MTELKTCQWCGFDEVPVPLRLLIVRCIKCGRIIGRYSQGKWIPEEECPYQDVCATTVYWQNEKAGFINDVCKTSEHNKCLHFIGSSHFLKEEQEFQRTHIQLINNDEDDIEWLTNEEFVARAIELGFAYHNYIEKLNSGNYIALIIEGELELVPRNDHRALIAKIGERATRRPGMKKVIY